MASVTSLPELITGISSVTYANTPDIAVGDVMGSCMFNILIICFLDLTDNSSPVLSKTSQGNLISAAFSIVLITSVITSLIFVKDIPLLASIGLPTFINMFIYFVSMKIIYQYEKRQLSRFIDKVALQYEDIPAKTAIMRYTANAIFVVAEAFFLPVFGEKIALSTGLGQTFVGNLFIATTTSLPEVIVSIAAVKIGAVDLAVGNLFGSNIFNIFILALDDIFYRQGFILAHASGSHIISGLAAILMTAVSVVAIVYKPVKKKLPVDMTSIFILLIYLGAIFAIYLSR